MRCREVVNHWVYACDVHPLRAAQYISNPNLVIRTENGFVILDESPLSHPTTIMSADEIKDSTVDLIRALITIDSSAGISICAMLIANSNTDMKLKDFATNSITMDAHTDGAMSARRPDLQHLVASGFVYLVMRVGRRAASSLIAASTATPWCITSRGPFFKQLNILINAAQIDTYMKPSKGSMNLDSCEKAESTIETKKGFALEYDTAGIIIDGCVILHMMRRDRTLLVYLYTFASCICHAIDAPDEVAAVASLLKCP